MVSPFTYLPGGTMVVTLFYFVKSSVRPVEFTGLVIYGQPIHLPSCRYRHSYIALFCRVWRQTSRVYGPCDLWSAHSLTFLLVPIIVTSLYFVESSVTPVEFTGPVIYGQPIHLPSCRYHRSYITLFCRV